VAEGSKILVIGESCLDIFHYGDCARLAPAAPVPIFNPRSFTKTEGMAMNVQKNIESLGQECDIITNPNWKEVTKSRYVHLNTNQMILRIDEGDEKIDRVDVKKLDLLKYNTIIISDYCKGFLTTEDIEDITSRHDRVFLDTKKILGPWAHNARFIKINFNEYCRSKHLLDETLNSKLIVTMGPRGTKYQDEVFGVKEVEIKDTSGAGDTFLAGLVYQYEKTEDIKEAIGFANACATTVVQKRGVSVV